MLRIPFSMALDLKKYLTRSMKNIKKRRKKPSKTSKNIFLVISLLFLWSKT